MSQDEARRIVAAAHRLRAREGPGFPLAQLAKPSGMSRATLYRRLAADPALHAEVEHIRTHGARSPREELLRAAAALVAERGISGLTMDAVAERAGLSTATLYRCFADRDGLVREVLRSTLSAEPTRRTLDAGGALEEVLARFVEALLARLRDQPHLLRLILFGDQEDVRALRRLRRDEERLSIAVIALLDRPEHRARLREVGPHRLMASLMGQVLGAVVVHRAHEGSPPPDAETIVTLFLHGACSQAPPRPRARRPLRSALRSRRLERARGDRRRKA